jgi:hypothetical protein
MHPIFASRLRLALYLGGWVLIGLVMASLLTASTPRPWLLAVLQGFPMALVYGLISLSAWWVCRAAPLGKTSTRRALGALLGAALVASLTWAVLGSAWGRIAEALAPPLEATLASIAPALTESPWGNPVLAGEAASPDLRRARDFALFIVAGVPFYLISVSVHYLVIAFEDSRAAERRALEAQVVARDAELRALRAQLNPHFLFNSLNSINALVGSDPDGARRMCERLGDFLRQTLSLAAHQTVPLGDEMALIDRYLGIERVRFGERLATRIQVEPEAARCRVPPLLLQPLVENAVKHGVSERLEGGEVNVRAELVGGRLRVTVENPCDEDPAPRPGHGMGLDNVRRRLVAVGERDAEFSARREQGVFRVVLSLPAVGADGGVPA